MTAKARGDFFTVIFLIEIPTASAIRARYISSYITQAALNVGMSYRRVNVGEERRRYSSLVSACVCLRAPLKAHGQIHCLQMLGDAADGDEIHAGLGDGANRVVRDAAGGLEFQRTFGVGV